MDEDTFQASRKRRGSEKDEVRGRKTPSEESTSGSRSMVTPPWVMAHIPSRGPGVSSSEAEQFEVSSSEPQQGGSLEQCLFFRLRALAQSAHRDEGGEAWKRFNGFDFSVRNPNHTGKAKPGTILKAKRKRRGREIPIKEAETAGH